MLYLNSTIFTIDSAKQKLQNTYLLLANKSKQKCKFKEAITYYQKSGGKECLLEIADCYYAIAKKTNDIADYREAAIHYESLYDKTTPNRHILEKLGMCYEALAKYPTTLITESISLYELAIQYHTQIKGLELHVRKTHKILGDKYAELSALEPDNFLHYEDIIRHYKKAGTDFCSKTIQGMAWKKYGDALIQSHSTLTSKAKEYYELAQSYDPNIEITEHVEDISDSDDDDIVTTSRPLLKATPAPQYYIPPIELDTKFFADGSNINEWLTNVILLGAEE